MRGKMKGKGYGKLLQIFRTRGNGAGRKAEHTEEHVDVIFYNGGERRPDSSKIDIDFIIQQC